MVEVHIRSCKVYRSIDFGGRGYSNRAQAAEGIEDLVHQRTEVVQCSGMSVGTLGLQTVASSSREVVVGYQEDL